MGKSIKRLVVAAKMFCVRSLPYKYLCYSFDRHFILVI